MVTTKGLVSNSLENLFWQSDLDLDLNMVKIFYYTNNEVFCQGIQKLHTHTHTHTHTYTHIHTHGQYGNITFPHTRVVIIKCFKMQGVHVPHVCVVYID